MLSAFMDLKANWYVLFTASDDNKKRLVYFMAQKDDNNFVYFKRRFLERFIYFYAFAIHTHTSETT